MKKRTIKMRLMSFDKVSLPEKEKMLPREALEEKGPTVKKRLFPKLGITVASTVALIVLMAIVIVGTENSAPKYAKPDIPPVLDNESFNDELSVNSIVTEESDAPQRELPIVSCGKYSFDAVGLEGFGNVGVETSFGFVPPGEVTIKTMTGEPKCIEELEDGVLYSVYFTAQPFGSAEYTEGLRRLTEERLAKKEEVKNSILDFIGRYAKAENHYYLEYYNGYDYQEICELIYNQLTPEYWPGKNAPEYEDIVSLTEMQIYMEYEEKISEFGKRMRDAASVKMYEYLEGLDIEFYDKTVYIYDSATEEIFNETVFRVAFLTNEQIAALKGVEDYGILVYLTFEEMAKMDNEPVYLEPWVIMG